MSALRLTAASSVAAAPRSSKFTACRPFSASLCSPQQPWRVAQLQLVQPQLQQQQQQRSSWVMVRAGASETASSGSSGAPDGQVSAAIMEAMQAKIKEELQADTVVVSDVYGDGRHVSINVVSNAFEGKNSVARQRMVYKAIWLELQETVHAVDAMTTKTPQEAAA